MISIEVLLTFTAAAMLMNISPGPSNLYVMARAIAQGVRGGIVAAMGLAVGSMIHVFATVLGLSALFKYSPTLYTIVKLAGAAYLIYLGYCYWKNSNSMNNEKVIKTNTKPLMTVFKESIIVEVTNPKTALFFIALLPQFVSPETGSISLQLFILGLIVTITAIPCDILVAIFSSKISSWLLKNKKAQIIQERVSGSILFGMGSFIVTEEAIAVNH
ncbi:LysE family translocator [Arcobacter sp. LA11]|uniref:LysE family translocator n=1 Tax=Arcobacter sp. LA11 TaxID=1898176 RepID=UPI00093217D5|nr:LysE family translocator [Arcobacter sp. LA11]